MSIISCVYVPEGIAMAADSRLTVDKNYGDGRIERYNLSDNSQKLFTLRKVPVGISACGDMILENKPMGEFLRIFEAERVNETDDIGIVASKLNEYAKVCLTSNITEFLVAGYYDEKPYVYHLYGGQVVLKNYNGNNPFYGATWRGETLATYKLFFGERPASPLFELMPLRDAVDFAEFIVELTIKYQRFENGIATCGGPIDLLLITRDEIKFLRHKMLMP